MAMLGSRLIDSTARSLAGQFFAKFAAIAGLMTEQTTAKKPIKKPKKPPAKKTTKKPAKKAPRKKR